MEEDQLRLMDLFQQNDRDGDNKISKDELHAFVAGQGLQWLPGQLDKVMRSLDADNNGYVDMQEFKKACRMYKRHVLRGKLRHTNTGDRRIKLNALRDHTFGNRASRNRTKGFFRRRTGKKGIETDAEKIVEQEDHFPNFPKFVQEWSKLITQVRPAARSSQKPCPTTAALCLLCLTRLPFYTMPSPLFPSSSRPQSGCACWTSSGGTTPTATAAFH